MNGKNETCNNELPESGNISSSYDYTERLQELQVINEILIETYQVEDIDLICRLTGEAVHRLNKDCYVLVSSYDSCINAVRVRAAVGNGDLTGRAGHIFGWNLDDLKDVSFSFEDMELNSQSFTGGKLEYFKGGLYALLAKKVPYASCKKIEEALNIGSILVAGFSNEKKIFGSVSILVPEGKKVRNISAIETIATHVSKKIQAIRTKKEVERKALENEKLLRSMMNAITESVTLMKPDHTVAYINETAAKRLNITQEECIGCSLDSITPEDILVHRKKVLDTVLAEGKSVKFEDTRDEIHFLHNVYPVYDSFNQFSHFAIFSMDITEYKKSEKKLKWELAINKELAELADALIDPNNSIEMIAGIVLSASQRLTGSDHGYVSSIDSETGDNVCHTLTRTMERCSIKGNDKKITFSEGPDGLYSKLQNHVLNTKKGFYTNSPETHPGSEGTPEGHIPLKNFLSIPAIVGNELMGQISLANSKQGYSDCELEAIRKIASLYALALQRKRASIEIRYRDTILKSIFESTVDGILVVDDNRKILFSNSKLVKMWRIPEALANMDNYGKLLSFFSDQVKYPEEYVSKVRDLYRSKETDISYVSFKDGRVFERSSAPLIINGILKGRVWSFRDVTEKAEAEKALIDAKIHAEEANRTKSEFLATMSHELRTPLNSVIGYSDILIDQMFGPLNERQLKYLKNISISGNHLLNLINDILDISRIESGDVSLSFETVHAADIFEDVKNIATPFATYKNISMKFSAEPADLGIYTDKIKLKQILHNLVNNALKFTPENGYIEVEAKKSEDMEDIIEICVRDNGIGIPEDKQQIIFEPFKQVDSSLSRTYSGTGLGLTIVKHLVEMQGGEIRVKSELTKGSTFTILWPVKGK